MRARGTRKVQTKKTNYMSDEAFADLKQALESSLAYERGGCRELVVTRTEKQVPRRSGLAKKASVKITRRS
jgi:hypothetical protein